MVVSTALVSVCLSPCDNIGVFHPASAFFMRYIIGLYVNFVNFLSESGSPKYVKGKDAALHCIISANCCVSNTLEAVSRSSQNDS
jgi:hypothetical protein